MHFHILNQGAPLIRLRFSDRRLTWSNFTSEPPADEETPPPLRGSGSSLAGPFLTEAIGSGWRRNNDGAQGVDALFAQDQVSVRRLQQGRCQ